MSSGEWTRLLTRVRSLELEASTQGEALERLGHQVDRLEVELEGRMKRPRHRVRVITSPCRRLRGVKRRAEA